MVGEKGAENSRNGRERKLGGDGSTLETGGNLEQRTFHAHQAGRLGHGMTQRDAFLDAPLDPFPQGKSDVAIGRGSIPGFGDERLQFALACYACFR